MKRFYLLFGVLFAVFAIGPPVAQAGFSIDDFGSFVSASSAKGSNFVSSIHVITVKVHKRTNAITLFAQHAIKRRRFSIKNRSRVKRQSKRYILAYMGISQHRRYRQAKQRYLFQGRHTFRLSK